MKKTALVIFMTLWATFDVPSLVGVAINVSGLILAGCIWQRWGRAGSNKQDIWYCRQKRTDAD